MFMLWQFFGKYFIWDLKSWDTKILRHRNPILARLLRAGSLCRRLGTVASPTHRLVLSQGQRPRCHLLLPPHPQLLCSREPLLCSVLPGSTEDGLSVRGLVRCCLLPGSHSVGSYWVLPEAWWGVRAKKGHITWCPWVLTPRATWQAMSDPSGDGQPMGASPHLTITPADSLRPSWTRGHGPASDQRLQLQVNLCL